MINTKIIAKGWNINKKIKFKKNIITINVLVNIV